MIFGDVLLERWVEGAELAGALSAAFGVPAAHVGLVESIEQLAAGPLPHGRPVVAEVAPARGDFACRLSLFVVDALSGRDPVQVARRLCERLELRALVPDRSNNPYSMLLVERTGAVRTVTLDARSLDEDDEYRLSAGDSAE